MHRHPVLSGRLDAARVVLDRAESRHLLSAARIRPGETVEIFDGRGASRRYRAAGVSGGNLTLEADGPAVRTAPPVCRPALFVCVTKGRRMDWTVEKAVELAAGRVLPVLSARSVVRLDEEGSPEEKADRWRRVALAAAGQCGAAWVPEIEPPRPFAEALSRLTACRPVLAALLAADARPLRDVLAEVGGRPSAPAWCAGPEGDFTPEEADALRAAGAIPVSLGPLILRAETAALYGLCAMGCAWGG
jgi:16S rRNA (uracil1498-N3)-methyltransferase